MDDPAVHFGTVLMALFAIMNPIARAPLFISLTQGLDPQTTRRIASRAALLTFAIVAFFAIGGRAIFAAFELTLPAFRIAGGALIGLVGYHMLQGEESKIHFSSDEDNEQSRDAALGIAISPLALPVLAGPGTIATAMYFSAESTLPEITRVLAALGVICAVTWASFVGGQSLTRFLGPNGTKVVTRLMGLILAVTGVQMLITGIRGAVALSSTN